MGNIPLPALNIRPPQQQASPIDQYAQLLQLRNAMQEGPLRQQALQQQVQGGQLQIQQEQQALKDQQAFRAAMTDPSNQGKTIGEVADALAKSGHISQATWVQAKKADTEQRTANATLDEKTLTNLKSAHEQTQQLYNNVMDMPDDQLAANWPQIAQQYDAIPGNQKVPLNPQQPLTKDQLKQFGPMISMANTYLDQELERRKAQTGEQTAETELAQKQQELQYGGSQQMADSKYRFLQQKLAAGQPVQPADQNFIKAYEKQKLLVPTANNVTKLTIAGMANNRAQDANTARIAQSAGSDLQKQFETASTQLGKVQDAKSLLAQGGNAADVLATVKTLSSLAGGQGSGVRITQAELNGILHNQGVTGNIESWISQLQGEGVASPQRRAELGKVLDAAEANLQSKMAVQDKYMDRLSQAQNSSEIRSIQSEYRKTQYQGGGNANNPSGQTVKKYNPATGKLE